MRQTLGLLIILFWSTELTLAQTQPAISQSDLTVQKIMQDPSTWIGDWPQNAYWTDAGKTLYFYWNPAGAFPGDSLYSVSFTDTQPRKVAVIDQHNLPPRFNGWQHGRHVYDAGFKRKVYARRGDLFLYDVDKQFNQRLTYTLETETNPRFSRQGDAIIFEKDDDLYRFELLSGITHQLTDVRAGNGTKEKSASSKEVFLENQQLQLFEHIRQTELKQEQREEARDRAREAFGQPPTFHIGKKVVSGLSLDATERFVALILSTRSPNRTNTVVQDYVTESGYAEDLSARPKVGGAFGTSELYIQDLQRDSTYKIDLHQLPGSFDVPAYKQETAETADSSETRRALFPTFVDWNPEQALAVIQVRARDNKDRWIALLDPENGSLKLLDQQHDDAWIGGPGISRYSFGNAEGWLPGNQRYFFQSEKTGYSHLHLVDTSSGKTTALTSGEFEIFNPMLSKNGQKWFFTSSEGSPFERHYYEMPLMGGVRTRLTTMPGNNQARIAPDEKAIAITHSYSNRAPEIFLQSPDAEVEQVTYSSTDAWRAYPWRDPKIIYFTASDGVSVPARMYEPDSPNGAAVLFVHGAGYLQNVHRWWSSYYREYMFHNLLADKGYTVLDVDYRASAGYGRDWRTAIYRHMGGRDLQDFVDASRYLQKNRDIDPERIFIYGGSYGGFITLMALFTEPADFGGGAALRSVTDWAHYNHGYTSNILNTPAEDSLAFARSSPIYFAEGLEDPLLIAHGVIDTNVQFQDVVRLTQRLIELGKEDWEMALYPVEGHGFTEPASWTDEYRRILELIEKSVGRQ